MTTKNKSVNLPEAERIKGAIIVAESMFFILSALTVSDKPGVKEAAEPKVNQAQAEVRILKSKLKKVSK